MLLVWPAESCFAKFKASSTLITSLGIWLIFSLFITLIFNLTLSDAKTIAGDYGQESFFFATVKEDKSTIAYYVTNDGCKTYKLVDVSETISDESEAEDYFSKFGFKFRINMREFGDEIPEITDRTAFEESFENSPINNGPKLEFTGATIVCS